MKKNKCPFCGSPSFVTDENQFMCFSCGMGGDKIAFRATRRNISYKEAATMLNIQLLPENDRSEEINEVLNALKKAEEFFYQSSARVKSSYFKKRKLSKETVESFRLGYAEGNGLCKYLAANGVSEDVAEKAGLLCTDEKSGKRYEKFWKRIMFPIHDENGNTIGFGGRVTGDEKPKYLNSPESVVFDKSHNLFALDIAKSANEDNFLLCEGFVDVISLHQNGFSNAVASLGTAFTAGQAELLRKYKQSVYLVYDSDGPGQIATEKAIQLLFKENIEVKVVSVAPYKDVDELLVKEGPDAFKKRMDEAESGIHFLAKGKTADELIRLALTEIRRKKNG